MDFNIVSAYNDHSNNIIPYSGVPLVTSEVRGYNPSQLISFVDLTTSVIENDPKYNHYEILQPTALAGNTNSMIEYILPQKFVGYSSGVLLVTDKTTISKYVDFTIPLYYQYQFMYDYYIMDPSLVDGFLLLRKNMESIVSTDNYVVQCRQFPTSSGRYINSNASGFIWGFNPISGNILATRLLLPIREEDNFYTVEYNKFYNGTITQYYDELVYEHPLYNQNSDYIISPSSIILTNNSNIGSGSLLYVQRDPKSYVTITPPIAINDSIKTKPWNIQIKCGEFVHSSGILGGLTHYQVKNYFTSIDAAANQVISDEVPKIINKNIIKLSTIPLYDSGSGYPDYNISSTIISGVVNGVDLKQNITSIDYTNGYLYVNMDLKPTDNISLAYTYNDKKSILINSLDLNPKNSVNAVIDIALNNIGIVVVPSGTQFYSSLTNTLTSNWSNMAYYKLNDNPEGNFGLIPTSGFALEGLTEYDTNGPISGLIPSGSKLMGYFSLNSLSSNMVKLYDSRRLGGYDPIDVKTNVSGWRGFSDIGFWDGEAFPIAGTILIQIPSGVYDNITAIFTNNIPPNPLTAPYTADLEKIINRDTVLYDSQAQQIKTATNKYIRDVIERYLPYGTLYIIVDENFNVWPSIRSDA